MKRRVHRAVRGAVIGLIGWCVALLTGCVARDYMEMYDLPASGWQQNQSVVFTFVPLGVDTLHGGTPADRWIDITVRHRADFAYAELPLEIKAVAPDKQFWVDTVYLPLGKPSEGGEWQWSGQHYSNHYDLTQRYRSRIRYRTAGEYALSIRQLSGEDPLRGILSLGVTVSQAAPSTGVE